ncbi:MAG: hypothetical protein OQK00_01985 [Rhodobacteraceae bacterium]|nr:hypothetical protein [Paracoccaceae bacterium]MCW9044425.1 hypothetical protein [Pseudopelagicola sp.]
MSLTLYGPLSVAASEDGGIMLTMEICADGVSQVVLVGADGEPVDPSKTCPDCDCCCLGTFGAEGFAGTAAQDAFYSQTMSVLTPFQVTYIYTQKRSTRPMPRGPPVMHLSMLTKPELSLSVQRFNGHKTRSDGRPILKDATA